MPDGLDADVLSEVFEQVEVLGMVTGGFAVRGPWVSRGVVTRPFKLIALVAGSAQVSVDGAGGPDGPVRLGPGDVVLLNHRSSLDVRGGRGDAVETNHAPSADFDQMALAEADLATDDVLVGGWIQTNPAGVALLGAALPGLVHVRADSSAASRLGDLVTDIFEEATHRRPGASFAMRQHGQLLLLEVVRTFLEHDNPPPGWLRLLADAPLAPAVRLIHSHPDRSWGLRELAGAANMSRTSFAERFRATAGTPPLAYLSAWRMLLAQRALRNPDARVGAIAADLGYGSDSAFSAAFKRETGLSPLRYRQQLLTGRSSNRADRSAAGQASPSG